MKKLSQKEMKAVKGGDVCPYYGVSCAYDHIPLCLVYPPVGYSGGGGGNCGQYNPPYIPPGG